MSRTDSTGSGMTYTCPHCQARLEQLAQRCPRCNRELTGLPAFSYRPVASLVVKVIAVLIVGLILAASVAMLAVVFGLGGSGGP